MRLPARPAVTVVTISADSESEYDGHLVYLGASLIGYRPYDGSDVEEVAAEVTEQLALMLRERFGWKTSP